MPVKVTISLEKNVKQALASLARENKSTVSGYISEIVKRERIRHNILDNEPLLGTQLRTHKDILKNQYQFDYKEMLGTLREEKHLK